MARTESTYPTSVDVFTNATTDFNPGDSVPSSDFEKVLDAIKNIETKLGITGGAADLDSAVVINESGLDKDFRVEGNSNINLLYCDAGNDNISINAAAVSTNYDLGLFGDGVLCIKETSTPTADTNYGKVYCKNDNLAYFQDGAGTEHLLTPDGLEADGTAGRVLRISRLTVDNGTNASTLKCTLTSYWNGDTIAETDNIAKGATTGDFTLNAGGTNLIIEASGLTGNAVAATGKVIGNATGQTTLLLDTSTASNDIYIYINVGVTQQDMTVLVDTGIFYIDFLYITSA